MGKFDALAKFLGLSAEKFGDDAAKVLEKVDNAELAVSLPGKERGQYLKALDEVYGPQSERAAQMGFFPETYYHGTGAEFQEFDPTFLKRDANAFFGKKPVYVAKDASRASEYADEARENFNIDEKINQSLEKFKKIPDGPEKNKMWMEEVDRIYNQSEQGIGENVLPLKIRGSEINYSEAEKLRKMGYSVPEYYNLINDEAMRQLSIKEPNQIRSQFAAFDPRFKDSPLLMAGALAAPMGKEVVDMNPLQDIKAGLGYYEKAKEAITKPLASQLNIGKNPQDEAMINEALKLGLDPVNYIPGAAGVAAGAVQMLTPSDEEIAKINALKKMRGY